MKGNKRKRKSKGWLKWILKWVLILWLFQICIVVLFKWIPIPVTPLILIRGIEKISSGQKPGYYKSWKSIDNISPHLPAAIMSAEDQNFLKHTGFDFEAIRKAREYNRKQQLKGSQKMRGASTLSQQTAKNVFLWPGRSWLRKGLEVYFTFLIEKIWGKKRILEVYMNVAEMGNGIYGAEAAAQQYWKSSAVKMSKEQTALLAAILPSPRRYSATKPGPYIRGRQEWILRQMRHNPQFYELGKSNEKK